MTGKVFSESTDIYQDQAQVLFDYYRQAAEKIVSEEIEYEQKISEIESQQTQVAAESDSSRKALIAWAIGAAVSLLLVVIHPIFMIAGIVVCGYMAYKQIDANKKSDERAQELANELQRLEAEKQAIRRDYRVERVGVAYVPVARRVASGDKSYVVDITGDQPETEFSLTLINQPDELKSTMDSLHDHMQDMPAVESNDDTEVVDTADYSTSMQDITLHDYMGTIDRDVRKVRYLINDSRSVSVSMPVVPPASDRYLMLDEYATSDTSDYPVISVFDTQSTEQKVEEFSSLGALNQQSSADGSGDVSFFVDVMRQLAQGVDMLSRSRTASMTALNEYSLRIFQNVLKASFNQYSPLLEAEEIERIRVATFNYADEAEDYTPFSLKESSRVHYEMASDAWIADNGTRTAMPFGMHQVDAEVLMPVISNLMLENRVERLRIYSDIQNQKTDYLNQWHRDTDDFFGRNRTEANALIQRMNEAYAEYVESYTNYQQQSAAFTSMKSSGSMEDAEIAEIQNEDEIIAGFQVQTNQARAKQEEFTAFMERVREDIEESAEQFGHVEYYEASLRDSQARENARSMDAIRDLDARRQRLAFVSPYLAQHGTVPPVPQASERLVEDFAIDLSKQVEDEIHGLALYGDAPTDYNSNEGMAS